MIRSNINQSTPQIKVVTLSEPEKPVIYRVDNLKPFQDTTLQTNFCLVCWKLVIIGPTRIKCLHCPVVVHRYCVTNISDFFVPVDEKKITQETKRLSVIDSNNNNNNNNNKLQRPSSIDTNLLCKDNNLKSTSSLPSLKPTSAFKRERIIKPKTRIVTSASPSLANRRRMSRQTNEDNLPPISPLKLISNSPVNLVDTSTDETTREVRWVCPFCIHEV